VGLAIIEFRYWVEYAKPTIPLYDKRHTWPNPLEYSTFHTINNRRLRYPGDHQIVGVL